jgi:DNA-binding FadR family transcriptional regulator
MTQQVADAVRQKIRDENLQPGDRLGREQDLAREFGVSRPTMREALRLLSSGGMLRSTKGPGGGTFVQRSLVDTLAHSLADRISDMLDVNAVSLEELMTARVAVEVPIARLAAQRADDETIAELRRLTLALDHDPHDPDATMRSDAGFHRTIASASGNPMLQATIGWAFEVLQPRLYEAVPPKLLQDVLATQHRAIVDAIAAHDPDAAETAMRAHLDHLRALVLREAPAAQPAADEVGAA